MISWIQNHLIRHGRWIFLTLLAIIIFAFVFTIGNTPGCTTNKSNYEENLFYGYDLNSIHEMEVLGQKVALSNILNTGRPIQNEQQFQSRLIHRIALLHLADKIGIPVPSSNTLAKSIQSKAAFRGPDGQFSRDAYTRFVDRVETDPSMQQGLIIQVLEEDYRIEKVESVLSGPGYLLPSEALAQVQLNETTLKITTAEIDYSDFEPEITYDPDALNSFYINNIKRYEIPERIQASYVRFPTAQYIRPADNFSEEDLRKHFVANRARFVAAYQAAQPQTDDAEPEAATPPTVTLEDVRSDVINDLTTKTARKLANTTAQNFALTLYRNNIKLNTPEFKELLDKQNLEVTEIAPYTAEEASSRKLSAEMLKAAFALNEKRYFSDAYELDDGFGVLLFSKRIPPEIPPYEAVEETVKADFSAEEKRRLFNEHGKALENELSALLDAETEFSAAAEVLELAVKTYEAFKINEAPRTINQAVLQRAQTMQAGELSPMITAGDSGLFVYIDEKTVPEIDADNEGLKQTSRFLKQLSVFTRSSTLTNELITQGFPQEE